MMGMILRGEAEISVAEFAITVLRTEVVDFTVPLFDTRCTVLLSGFPFFLPPFCNLLLPLLVTV
jgi:hypothetical protein